MEDNIKCYKDIALAYFIKEINYAEVLMIENKNLNDFISYCDLENKLVEYINKIESIEDLQKRQLKKELFQLLKERYELNQNNYYEHRKMKFLIARSFNIYMSKEFNCLEELLAFSQTGNSIKDQNEMKSFIYYLQKIKESNLNFYIKEDLNLNYAIPQFLLINHSKLIKQRIIVTWQINFIKQYNYYNKLVTLPEYLFLYKQYSDFFDGRIDIFDEKYLNKEENKLLFQGLYYLNGEYLRYDSNVIIFLNNSRRYLDLMHFERKDQSAIVSDCFDYIKKNTKDQIDNKLKEILNQLYSHIGGIEEGKINEKLLYVVFCFSSILNGVIYAEGDQNIKAVFASSLKCSAKERVFLFNFLSQYDSFIRSKDNKCVYYNHLMENSVLSALIKSYTKVLYDEQNNLKISFTYEQVMSYIQKSGVKRKETKHENENEEQDYLFGQLNDMEREYFTRLFDKFKEDIHEKDKDKDKEKEKLWKKPLGLLNKLANVTNITSISMIQLHKPIMKNKKTLLLFPTNPISISIHICICINGIFMNGDLDINDSHMWYNIITKDKTVDYYVYNWQNEDNMSLDNGNMVTNMLTFVKNTALMQNADDNIIRYNKKMSKKFGKLLAYIIASRSVFKFHTLSLMGFSLGCNVIKNCLKELKKISTHIDASDIIQNIIFLGGATTFKQKHKDIFGLVSGSVYNFYSRTDSILFEYYSKDSIGIKELMFHHITNIEDFDKSYQPRYFNVDLSKNQYNQSSYGIDLNKLIKIIKYY